MDWRMAFGTPAGAFAYGILRRLFHGDAEANPLALYGPRVPRRDGGNLTRCFGVAPRGRSVREQTKA